MIYRLRFFLLFFVIFILTCEDQTSPPEDDSFMESLRAISEWELIQNAEMHALLGQLTFTDLEHKNTPRDSLLVDSHLSGTDVIPYYFSKLATHTFTLDTASYLSVKFINPTTDQVLFELTKDNREVNLEIDEGFYEMHLISSLDFHPDSINQQMMFVKSELKENNALNKTKEGAGDLWNYIWVIISNSCIGCDFSNNKDIFGDMIRSMGTDNIDPQFYPNWANTNFYGSTFDGATISYINFTNCNFSNCSFGQGEGFLNFTYIENAGFYNCNFTDANMSAARIRNVEFYGSNFTNANLYNNQLSNVILDETNFTKSYFNYGRFSGTRFTNAIIDSTEFRGVHFSSTNFSNSSLENTIFASCDFYNTNFKYANLSYADFQGSSMVNVDFSYANLIGTNFCNIRVVDYIHYTDALRDSSTKCLPTRGYYWNWTDIK